ncbi:hypothetical protein C8R47DRAFT_1148355 [Mycena vitilis]|nr:hypothetical protein C8R47DRAFT_1148355 [Mycena vitilis]
MPQIMDWDPSVSSKKLPNRGTLFHSRPEAVGFHGRSWATLHLVPVLLLTLTLFGLGGDRFKSCDLSPGALVGCMAYCGLWSTLTVLTIATMIFPTFFHYHIVIQTFFAGHARRHRSHYSFMSLRRRRQTCRKSVSPLFTIFILGLDGPSLPLPVSHNTTMSELYQSLSCLGHVPLIRDESVYFKACGRKVSWDDSIRSLCLGPLSNIEVRTLIVGGAHGDTRSGTKRTAATVAPEENERPPNRQRRHHGSAPGEVQHPPEISNDHDVEMTVDTECATNNKGKGRAMEPNPSPFPPTVDQSIPIGEKTGIELLDNSGVQYCRLLQIFVCTLCRSCIRHEHLWGHFANSKGCHGTNPGLRAPFVAYKKDPLTVMIEKFRKNNPLLDKPKVDTYRPSTVIAPFSFLPVSPGFVCTQGAPQTPCNFAAPKEATLKSHQRVHKNEPGYNLDGETRRAAHVQQLCCVSAGGQTSFFEVDPSLRVVDDNPTSAFAEWYSAFQRKWRNTSFFPHTAVDLSDPDMMTPFLQKSGWLAQLQGYSVMKLRALSALPGKDDPLYGLRLGTLEALKSISTQDFEKLHFTDRQTLLHWKRGSPEFRLLIKDGTLDTYSLLSRKLILFVIRACRRKRFDGLHPPIHNNSSIWSDLQRREAKASTIPGPDIADQMTDLADFATDEQIWEAELDDIDPTEVDIINSSVPDSDEDDDSDGVEYQTGNGEGNSNREQDSQREGDSDEEGEGNSDEDERESQHEEEAHHHSLKRQPTNETEYPVQFTAAQKQHAHALDEALQAGKSGRALVPLIHTLLFSLFTDQVQGYKECRSTTAVEAFLLSINTLPSGAIRPVVNITPDLSIIQYLILFSILKQAMQAPDVTVALAENRQWFTTDAPCVFAAIRYYQHLAWNEVKGQVGVARVLFFRDSDEFTFDGKPGSFLAWIKMVQSLWVEAESILREEILMGIPFEAFGFSESEAVDGGNQADKVDNGFAASRNTGRETPEFRRVMAIFGTNERFTEQCLDPKGENGLNRYGCMKWLRSVQKFKTIVFFLLHLVSGSPKRITELLLHKLFATHGRRRNIFWILRRIFIIGDYSKTTGATGRDKKTVHIVPPTMQPGLFVFFMAAIPVEIYLLADLGMEQDLNAHCYLFAGMGQRWKRDLVTHLFKELTHKYLGCAFGIAQIRQFIPAMIRHFRLGGSLQPSTMDRAATQGSGHTPGMADSHYGNSEELLNLLTNGECHEILGFSEVYHNLWGFGSRDGLTPVTAVELAQAAKGPMATKIAVVEAEVVAVRGEVGVMNAKLNAITEALGEISHLVQSLRQSNTAGGNTSVCPECDGSFPSSSLINHVRAYHKRYVYPTADEKLAVKERFVYRHHTQLQFQCECRSIFAKEYEVQRHIDALPLGHEALTPSRPKWGLSSQ